MKASVLAAAFGAGSGFDIGKFMAAAEADSQAVKAKAAELGLEPAIVRAIGLSGGKVQAVFGTKSYLNTVALGIEAHSAFAKALGDTEETERLERVARELYGIAASLPDDLGQIVT